jgi:hypothetical protein
MAEGNPSSTGWATFEARIRERRFARCIERVAASLDADSIAEAREALDEARELCPDRPEIAEFESLIASRPEPSDILLVPSVSPYAYELQQQEVPAGWTRVLAAVAVLIILFGLFGFGLTQVYLNGPEQVLLFTDVSRPSPEPVGTSSVPERMPAAESAARTPATIASKSAAPQTIAAAPAPPERPTIIAEEPRPAATVPVPTTAPAQRSVPPVAPPAAPPAREKADASNLRATQTPLARPPAPQTAAAARSSVPQTAAADRRREESAIDKTPSQRAVVTTPVADSTARRETPPSPPPPLPEKLPAVEPAVSTAPPEPETAARGTVPPPVPALATPPAARVAPIPAGASRAEESAQIRSVLARYESAYNKLDASGASSVWPTVDQAALDRAFRGLVSQRVSLGLCDITVFGDVGGASCAGKARWEPKVGGGLQTADRHWTFNLRKNGESWRIEQVRVR